MRASCNPGLRAHAQGPRKALLFGGAVLAATKVVLHRGQGQAFVPTPTTGVGAGAGFQGAKAAVATDRLPASPSAVGTASSSWPSLWSLAIGVGALAAGRSMRKEEPTPKASVPSLGLVPVSAEDSVVAMHTAGGRRKRLGVGGRICMLTGKKKYKGYTRSYSEKKNIRYWRPNTHWKKLWWEEEQKWVRLYVSARAIRKVDTYGLSFMAKKAGLDLHAWSRPHWMPGSQQPLCLRVGYTAKAKRDLRLWPDYIGKLNQGAALADIMPKSEYEEVSGYTPKPWVRTKGKGTPPKSPPKRLEQSKILKVPPELAL